MPPGIKFAKNAAFADHKNTLYRPSRMISLATAPYMLFAGGQWTYF